VSDKLKKLQIKKLIQEYDFLCSEDEYRKVAIEDNKNIFLDEVNNTRKDLNIPPPEPKPIIKTENIKKEGKPENVSDSTKSKVKKIYREIVKLTHPDRVNSEEMIEVYHKATIAADNYNILELFQICVDLKINIELDMEDVDVLNFLIQKKKEEIKKIETSFIWLWINAKTDEEKYKVVKMFVEQTSIG
jgi:hypothetical protein